MIPDTGNKYRGKGISHAVPKPTASSFTTPDPAEMTSAQTSTSTPIPDPSPDPPADHLDSIIEISDDDEAEIHPPASPTKNRAPHTNTSLHDLRGRSRPRDPSKKRSSFADPPPFSMGPLLSTPPRVPAYIRAEQAKKHLVSVLLEDATDELWRLSNTVSTARSTARQGEHEKVDKLLYDLSSQASRLKLKLKEVVETHNRR
ncbi:hypothetical protein QC762_511850 [Podospora pseudocomata]|uniref:Biogenesis of lysosome-related organelles complex 1 subunit KXD1 n=1 Tax=Podospora pseudocomata TaxID=2093779 RepID=A0ABR0GCA3_9PEZI|nr:hypothetical protein QC762_511850 [Podospora pseudocomata]